MRSDQAGLVLAPIMMANTSQNAVPKADWNYSVFCCLGNLLPYLTAPSCPFYFVTLMIRVLVAKQQHKSPLLQRQGKRYHNATRNVTATYMNMH